MKAAQINDYGDASVIKVVDVDKPVLTSGHVLVEVHASSLNPFDTIVRAGYMKDMMPLQFPATLGGDIAGIVSKISDDVEDIKVGDSVYGQANIVAGNSGAFAEFASTKAGQIAKMPGNTDFNQAASLPLVGASAIQALTSHISLKPGQKIFIHGGSGGIGTVAIQIAKNIGAYVATTATSVGIDYVKHLGVDEVIDYKTQDFSELLSGFDAVFDTVGGDDTNKALTVLKSGGTLVTMAGKPDEQKAKDLEVNAIYQSTHVTTEVLNVLRDLVESGVITTHIDKTFELDDIVQAFEARESGSIKGKVVISIKK